MVEGRKLSRAPEPIWPGLVALVAVGGLDAALPPHLSLGPPWLPIVCVAVLLVPSLISLRGTDRRVARFFGYATSAVVSLFLIASVGLLVFSLPEKRESPVELLRSAAELWITNVIVFAGWYWRLDGGGPAGRELRRAEDGLVGHMNAAFLFPQMQMDPELARVLGSNTWTPGFVDYLFLAFNTSTALSPADTGVLNRWAKAISMLQSLISLTVIVLLAAHAVNIL